MTNEKKEAEPKQILLKPTTKAERIQTLDVLRGLAIFGIFVLNIKFFAYPDYGPMTFSEFYPGIINKLVKWFTSFFIETKFYSMFSFLFGIGMAVLWDRCQKKNIKFTPFFSRRLVILLFIGIFHGYIIWDGDILMTYAYIGFMLLAFKKRTQKTIIIWAIIFALIPMLMIGGGYVGYMLFNPDMSSPEKIEEKIEEVKKDSIKKGKEELKVFSEGSYLEQLAKRFKITSTRQIGSIFYGWQILSMFLLGLWAWRKKIFQEPENNLKLIKKTLKLGLIIGILANLISVIAMNFVGPKTTIFFLISMLGSQIGAPTLCLGYISIILLLMGKQRYQKILSPFASVGRMALSNYLFQTLICTTIFYSYGFGLYGKFSPAQIIIIVPIIYIFQVWLSNWWMKRYKFGPAEWLWRSLTYKKMQAMKIDSKNNIPDNISKTN